MLPANAITRANMSSKVYIYTCTFAHIDTERYVLYIYMYIYICTVVCMFYTYVHICNLFVYTYVFYIYICLLLIHMYNYVYNHIILRVNIFVYISIHTEEHIYMCVPYIYRCVYRAEDMGCSLQKQSTVQ